jgi:hypothetical protein
MERLICPHIEDCKFYRAWTNQTDNTIIDVIHKQMEYSCMILEALRGNSKEELGDTREYAEGLVSDLYKIECSHIELLNNSKNSFPPTSVSSTHICRKLE